MSQTPDPTAFEDAVRAYLEPVRGQFNYEQMLHTFLSAERFRLWARVINRWRPLAGVRFLSSGCGFAGSLLAYRDAGARVAVGVEVDAEYLRLGGLRTAELPAAGVVAYDGERLPFPDGSFDVIESMDVIEHTSDPGRYLAELRRVLSPGGLVLLVTPNRLWPVEQHLGIVAPPWLPVRLADVVFGALARLPWLNADRRFRYRQLRGMRTQNLSLRRLQRLVKRHGLFLRLLHADEFGADWPLPPAPVGVDRLARHRLTKFLAPLPTLAVILEPAPGKVESIFGGGRR
jgi:SAM-dependent methyltransferase